MDYLAHRNDSDGREQRLVDHLSGVAEKSESFAAAFADAGTGRVCGLIHDVGKYSDAFQRRLRGANITVDHSTAGALEAIKILRDPVVAMCVAGHHSGLLNSGSPKSSFYGDGTLFGRLKAEVGTDIGDYYAYKKELTLKPAGAYRPRDGREAFFYTHMLFSCLVDADYLDTEAFMSRGGITRGNGAELGELSARLDAYIKKWEKPKSDLNIKRNEILGALIKGAGAARGLFTLTVPTGGGKTVASMAFALRHALANTLPDGRRMRRIIYIIPYVSIIEQTQSVFEDIFGEENVLAHYADMYSGGDDDGVCDRKKLAAENWDAPIILTTAVRFFESIFSNRSSSCRKLHNIAESVLIFDEAQMLPCDCITPCLWAISQLVGNYRCSAVLCTATKPAFGKIFGELLPAFPIRELCPEPEKMYELFRRVSYSDEGTVSVDRLAAELSSRSQVLCVVNTRKTARTLYEMIKEEGSYHLSTFMTPFDRRRVLDEIRLRLKNGQSCRVVSTSLIEAGVDVDFPSVYREYAGLDSIIQAGGRCNREGGREREESIVHYFKTGEAAPQYIRQNVSAAEHAMRKFADISSPEAINEYFSFLLYTLRDESARDAKGIMRSIDERQAFADVARDFRMIEDSGCTIVIPEGDGAALAGELKRGLAGRNTLRRLGRYSVGVYREYFNSLVSLGRAELVAEGLAVLSDMSLYDAMTGLEPRAGKMENLIY